MDGRWLDRRSHAYLAEVESDGDTVYYSDGGSAGLPEVEHWMKEICPRGNNKVVVYISLYHDKCLLFMLELY